MVTAAAVAVYAAVAADRGAALLLALGAVSLAVLVAALARADPSRVPPALVGLAAAWTASAWTRGGAAPASTALAAAGIFVVAELAYWSVEQAAVADEPELVARRLAGLAVRTAAALVLAAFILAALGLHAGSGLVLEAVGVTAAVGLLALIFALARTDSPER